MFDAAAFEARGTTLADAHRELPDEVDRLLASPTRVIGLPRSGGGFGGRSLTIELLDDPPELLSFSSIQR
jgi:hypothetical protein